MSCRYPRHNVSRQPSSSAASRSQAARSAARSATAQRTRDAAFNRYMAHLNVDLPALPANIDEKDAFERAFLQQTNKKQFGCYMMLLMRLHEADVPPEQLRARYASVLPVDDTHTANVLSMTAAVMRNGVQRYETHSWPILYAAELPAEFMADDNRVDRLVRHVNTAVDANGVFAITRDYIANTLIQQVEAEVAAEAASRTDLVE